jgi:hypothetical protein
VVLYFIPTYVAEIQGAVTITGSLVGNNFLGILHWDIQADSFSHNRIRFDFKISEFIRQQYVYRLSKRKIISCLLVGGFNPDEYRAHRVPSCATHHTGISICGPVQKKIKIEI